MAILYEDFAGEVRSHRLLAEWTLKGKALGRYEDTLAEAASIEKKTGVKMTVEAFKPIHFGWSSYLLPVGSHIINLKDKCRFYPVGVWSNDPDFVSIDWWEGAKISFLYSWLTKFVYYKEEKEASMWPQPVFRGTFTFTVNSEAAKPSVDAWIVAWVVLPEAMREMPITQ